MPSLAGQGKALFYSKDDGNHHPALSWKSGDVFCVTLNSLIPVKQ